MNIALLLMGGKGVRFGANVPKQFVLIDEIPIFAYILKALEHVEQINRIIIVCHKDWKEYVNDWAAKLNVNKLVEIVEGGRTRSESILNGIIYAKCFATDDDILLLHDATHPYVDAEGIRDVIEKTKEYGAATLVSREYDTCYRVEDSCFVNNVEKREEIMVGASPEAFVFGKIYDIYINSMVDELEQMTSAGALAIKHNIPMAICYSNLLNLKITYKEDFKVLKELIHSYYFPGIKFEINIEKGEK